MGPEELYKTEMPWYKAWPKWVGNTVEFAPYAVFFTGAGLATKGLFFSGDPYSAEDGSGYATLGACTMVLGTTLIGLVRIFKRDK